jgi:hypothetical protein
MKICCANQIVNMVLHILEKQNSSPEQVFAITYIRVGAYNFIVHEQN